MRLTFAPMTPQAAGAIVDWIYEPPYDIYNVVPARRGQAIAELRDPAHAYYTFTDDETSELIGFCCFGKPAQVPGGDYAAPALDVGIGLRPDLTGRRLGPTAIAAMLDLANALFNATTLRATIASFNERSIRAFASVGFAKTGEFANDVPNGPRKWVVMVL